MPTNVTPEYKKAEEAFRRAREPRERLDCLKEMLRNIPKHKGTEHLQADIKSRIKQLTEELGAGRKTGARGLRTIIEGVLLNSMYDLPSLDNVSKVVVDETVIEGEAVIKKVE